VEKAAVVKTIVIAGARPNFVKVAPLLPALWGAGLETIFVHTGQHYDWAMSESLFSDLGIPAPDVNFGIGSGSHGVQTGRLMLAFDEWLDGCHGQLQLVTVGDVNSTLACTLVAAKREIPVAHVEAGLRSFDRSMPEEVNRLVVDSLASWLFTSSPDAGDNLLAEGAHPSRIHFVGNIMVDSLLMSLERALSRSDRDGLDTDGDYGLVTLHRPALVDKPLRLRPVLRALNEVAADLPLVFPVHPRTRANLARFGLDELAPGIKLIDPVGYLEFLRLEARASLVLTDSGGIQEETTVLGVPCLTLRDNTERPITITHGTNHLVGLEPDRICSTAARVLSEPVTSGRPPMWDGRTAERVAAVLSRGLPPAAWVSRDLETDLIVESGEQRDPARMGSAIV
jgi:UDP-N-acetylglucosamine 2-epimerase (non-hydrolysing)